MEHRRLGCNDREDSDAAFKELVGVWFLVHAQEPEKSPQFTYCVGSCSIRSERENSGRDTRGRNLVDTTSAR